MTENFITPKKEEEAVMPIPEKTSIEALLDIVRGMQEAVKYKDVQLPKINNTFFENFYRNSALHRIPYQDVIIVVGDRTLGKALERAGLGDLMDFLVTLGKYYIAFILGLMLQVTLIDRKRSFKTLTDAEIGEVVEGLSNPETKIDDPFRSKVDAEVSTLYKHLTFEFVESIYTRLNRLPVGFPSDAILPNRNESRHKLASVRVREDRELMQVSVNQLDIGAGSTRISQDVGIYQRENGMLYVRVMIGGKLIRRSLGTKKTQEALLKTGSVIKAVLEDRESKELPMLADFVDRYKEYSEKQHAETTYDKSLSRIDTLVKNLGSMRLDKISKQAIKLYSQKRLQEVSSASVNRELSLLSSIMGYAVDLDLIQENPVKKFKKLKESPGRDRYLTGEEVKKLLDACHALGDRKGVGHNPILYEIVLTAILTGLRKGNLQNLKWSQVDLETGNIVIPASEHKNKKPLYFPLNPFLREVLTGLRNSYPFSEYVFSKSDGTPYGDWKRSFETACEIAGFKDVHFHDLRHTHGTFLNMLGENDYTITSLMGHKTLAASKRYVHTPPELVKRASEKLGDYLMGIVKKDKDETGN